MAIIAYRIPCAWFNRHVLREPFILRHAQDERRAEGLTITGHPELVEGCRSVCANNYVRVYRLDNRGGKL